MTQYFVSAMHSLFPAPRLRRLMPAVLRQVFDSYRPELHYMRGPGPKWHAKQAYARVQRSPR